MKHFPTCWKETFGPFSVLVSAQTKDVSITQKSGAGTSGHSRVKPKSAIHHLSRIANWLKEIDTLETHKGIPQTISHPKPVKKQERPSDPGWTLPEPPGSTLMPSDT